jgi:cyclase
MATEVKLLDWADFPDSFVKWKINPLGAQLETKEISPGVYILLSSITGVNNTGFVVGEKGVLVIDAHFTLPMAHQILERIREVTDKPILYLVNLNYHGDHTFGNCEFPDETRIIQQHQTAARTAFFEEEMAFMLPCVGNDKAQFKGVTYRGPDIVFGDYLKIDLGDRVVECHYFGPANTPGDTIVYVPEAKAAWMGNLTGGNFGLALETDAQVFRDTVTAIIDHLDIDLIVSAHRSLAGPELLDAYLEYFSDVTDGVQRALEAGRSLEQTLDQVTLSKKFTLPPDDPLAVPNIGRHHYNIQRTYRALSL